MDESISHFEIPRNIDRYLATISKLYAQEDKQLLQKVVVNSHVRIHEAQVFSNVKGDTWGHHLYLRMPEVLFLGVLPRKYYFQEQIKDDLNNLYNISDEYIDAVFFEMEPQPEHDWRSESGLLIDNKRQVPASTAARIWGTNNYRVFLSHRSDSKKDTAYLKGQLKLFGISAFVAHEDIHPTKQWQDEIEQALASMDAFVALMTPDFHESDWTDQEVGYAFARGVPIVAANLGKLPYGFIGKFQALKTDWDDAAVEIAKLLVKHDPMLNVYIDALAKCPSWGDGITLSKVLGSISNLTPAQADKMLSAYNENYELRGSFGFNGTKPKIHGPGLVHYLNQLDTSRRFEADHTGQIRVI